MAKAREIQGEMKSVGGIGQFTKAIGTSVAVKIHKARERAAESRAYVKIVEKILGYLNGHVEFLSGNPQGKPLILVITPSMGLTGGLIDRYYELMKSTENQLGGNAEWMAIGKKGVNHLRRHGHHVVAELVEVSSVPDSSAISEMAEMLLTGFQEGRYSMAYLIYATSRSVVNWQVVSKQLLPVVVPEKLDTETEEVPIGFGFEPNPEEVAEELLKLIIEPRIFQALLESKAAEFVARRMAMDQATKAIEDKVGELRLEYNKARQGGITGELLDIIGGMGGRR